MDWQSDAKKILDRRVNKADESRLLQLLEQADGKSLSAFVESADMRHLILSLDDHRKGAQNRQSLFELLFQKRIDDLSVSARAATIKALQKGRTGGFLEIVIQTLLLATKGKALSDLKELLDRGEDHRDIQQLIYSDIDDGERRDRILKHFKEEALSQPRRLKMLSDIDDTLYANWKDKRYPKKTVYPGVRAFYASVSETVAFVTARPKDRPGYIEKSAHQTLRSFGIEHPVVLSGSFLKVLSNKQIAEKKFQNFVQYKSLFPECDFVFLGDSGQGDAAFAIQMREHSPHEVPATFIHDVVALDAAEKSRLADHRVFVSSTYIGVAFDALRVGVIEEKQAQHIRSECIRELRELVFDDAEQQKQMFLLHDKESKAMSLWLKGRR